MSIVKVETCDRIIFEIDEKIAMMSNTIKNKKEDKKDDDEVIFLTKVTSDNLEKILPWLLHHKDDPLASQDDIPRPENINDISEWDRKYFENFKMIDLFAIITAATYLNIKGFLDSSAKLLAQMMLGKTPEDIKETFNISPLDPVVDDESTSKLGSGSSGENK
ncbi:S-phase kinase-associated protein 1-like [Microplitis demolitor]|uniref:S-phase kinase-associated protein 1-like n=1 Tax=Microplitis demolitor TaxID=69319 RepID=UPI00235B6B75|nr:S-phase kinase-associated protein 1-like [Microplitis demolitor]